MPLFDETPWPIYYRWVTPAAPDKQTVLFLHGLGSSGEDWLPQWADLGQRWSILTVDLPGHGHSPPVRKPLSVAELAETIAALLRAESVDQVHLVGLSLGALVGLQLAVDQAQSLRSMILVNGFARFKPGQRGLISAIVRLGLLLLGRMDWVGAWVARSVFPGPEQVQFRQAAAARIGSVDRRTYWHYVRAIASFNVLDPLERVRLPTMVVAGAEDRIVAMSAKRELADRLPEAELRIFANSGHGTPIDAMGPFNKLLVQWLKDHE